MLAQSQELPRTSSLGGRTLLELLRFYAESYVALAKDLQDLEHVLIIESGENEAVGRDADALSLTTSAMARRALEDAKSHCRHIGLQVCSKHVSELLPRLNIGYLSAREVKSLHENIERELSCHFFVGIPQSCVSAYTESRSGWEDIAARFPGAIDDIEEMNKCYALARYTAAVFHSLLVVEHGLVKLGELLKVTDPKEGWDASCKKLAEVVKAGYKANTTELDYVFLEQLNTCVQVMKLAWRNKVNHATGKPRVMSGGFAPYVAEEIIATTRGFMRRLAEGIS